MSLKVNTDQKRPGVFVVSPIGSIDSNTHTILDEKVDNVLENSPDVVIFDMEFTDYINSTGIRVLLKTKKALKKSAGKLLFMNLQPQIKKVFEILQALPTMKVFASIDEMDAYLDAMQKAAR